MRRPLMSGAEMADARKMRDGAPRRKVNGDVGHSHSVLRTDDTVFESRPVLASNRAENGARIVRF